MNDQHDAAVVRRACEDVPQLGDVHTDAARKVVLLRQWAFRKVTAIPLGDDVSRQLLVPPEAWRMQASEYLDLFDAGHAGALCGDAAWMLVRLYEAFGFKSYTYNFGVPGAYHVVTLVQVDDGLVVQDAFFDQDLRDEAGQLLDVVTVLNRLRAQDHESLRRDDEQPFPHRDVLMTDEAHANLPRDPTAAFVTAAQVRSAARTDLGHWRCTVSDHTWARLAYYQWYRAAALERLGTDGWPPQLDYLMLYPVGTSSVADGWTTSESMMASTPTAEVMRSIVSGSATDPSDEARISAHGL